MYLNYVFQRVIIYLKCILLFVNNLIKKGFAYFSEIIIFNRQIDNELFETNTFQNIT